MKITINYDLLEKIAEASYGFSLVKQAKMTTVVSAIYYSAYSLVNSLTMNALDLKEWLVNAPLFFALSATLAVPFSCFFKYILNTKDYALDDLNDLSLDLKSLNIETNEDLLLNAYKYHTEYSFDFEGIPSLIQKKYINIPVNDKEEVSLLQEHIIGSHTYTLSKKKKGKQMVFKLVTNN